MKIAYVIDDLGLGGAQRQLTELLKHLKDEHEIHVFSLSTQKIDYADEIRQTGIKLTLIGQSGKWDMKAFAQLKQGLSQFKPDIVHTWLFTADLYGRMAARLAGVNTVICAMRNTIDDMPWHYRFAARVLKRWTNCFTVNADAIRPGMIEALGIAGAKIRTIYNGIDLEHFPQRNGSIQKWEEWEIPEGAVTAAMVSRFAEQKDHETLVRAMVRVLKSCPDFYLLLVGEGPLRQSIEKLCIDLGIKKHVIFTGARRDAWHVLHAVDFYVHSTHFEGCSNAIMEAMAAGKAVIATNVGGNAELIAEGETGFLTNHQDAEGLADEIKRLVQSSERRGAMGIAARERTEKLFSLRKTVADTQKLYEDLLEKKK